MNNKEISKLNSNIETMNKNLEKLISLMENNNASPAMMAMVSGPKVSSISTRRNSKSSNVLDGMIIPLSALLHSGLQMSVEDGGVNVVTILENHVEYKSTCFNQVRYNPSTNELTVRFKSNNPSKKSYTYRNIDQDTYRNFIQAKSLGRYYIANIKGNYACQAQ